MRFSFFYPKKAYFEMWKFGTRQPRLYGKLAKNEMIDGQVRYTFTLLFRMLVIVTKIKFSNIRLQQRSNPYI